MKCIKTIDDTTTKMAIFIYLPIFKPTRKFYEKKNRQVKKNQSFECITVHDFDADIYLFIMKKFISLKGLFIDSWKCIWLNFVFLESVKMLHGYNDLDWYGINSYNNSEFTTPLLPQLCNYPYHNPTTLRNQVPSNQ